MAGNIRCQPKPVLYLNLEGGGTVTLKDSPGRLHRILVNSGSGSNQAIIYDNLLPFGLKIATLDVNKNSGSIEFGIDFYTGLTIVTTGITTDITVVYN